ncbi:MAG: hypothetical protein CML20_12440 [Rheinheimera sp.]|uniref:hypothetical protein n=1 Tax=Arsukibacterium sp. UBA3155 TaxID=1946058 RepID=UPI000C93CCAA|nr:hypothetical protein [Arsukibacterium sp. UBA3155]MAD75574.1 hypothetical protein [Rheinheimera sp.]
MRTGYLCFLLLPLLLQAQPLRMQQSVENNQRIFRYQFQALEQDIRLQFSLDPGRIQHNGNMVQTYVPHRMQQQLWRELQLQANQAGPYRLTPGPGGDWQNFTVHYAATATLSQATMAETEQLQQKLQQFSQQFQQQYVERMGYQLLLLADNRQLITVDHPAIIQQSLADMAGLAQTVVGQLGAADQQQLITGLLTWVQLIPEHPAEQRQYGGTFAPPLQVLRQHQGDSASKTVLLATLLRSSIPNVQLAILYLPERTLLALAVPSGPDDLTVTLQGTVYLVVDPSATEPLPPGQLSKIQKVYVLNQFLAYRLL